MKRILSTLIALMLVAGAAYAEQFKAVKKAGDMTVKVVIENAPLKVGNNTAAIELLDEKGRAITDAEVAVYYFMPAMPAMNYEVKASLSGDRYSAVVKPTMPGTWDAEVRVKMTGGDTKKVTINFEAK
jgi:nitrogen fixation protein FixH